MSEPTTEQPAALAVDTKALGNAALVAKLVMDELADLGRTAKGQLLPAMQNTGSSQQTVTAADNVKMATISLCGGTAKATVTDRKAFLAWVIERHPDEVRQLVNEAFEKAVLARADDLGEAIDVATGEVIPGVEFADRNQFLSVRPTKAARERIGVVLAEAGWLRQLPAGFTTGIDARGGTE